MKYTGRYLWRKLLRPSVVANDGIRLKIPAGTHPVLRRQIYRGEFETEEAQLLRKTVRPGDRVLDLGAGIGSSAVIAAKLSGQRVIAVEAIPELASAIRDNAALNTVDIEVVNAAAGTRNGEAAFYVEDMFVASSFAPSPSATEHVVPVIGITDLIERYRPTYLNVDIEGAEFDILPLVGKGEIRCVSVEIHDEQRRAFLIEAMRANGFSRSETLSHGAQLFFS